MKNTVLLSVTALVVLALGISAPLLAEEASISEETKKCLTCHESKPGMVGQWKGSAHFDAGVGCYECHKAEEGDVDAIDHYTFKVAVIVSPKDCGSCHPRQTEEHLGSHHAKGGDILNTSDGVLGQTIGGEPAVAVGCRQCHGSIVKVNDDGTLDTATWPNTGIGRVNPDGSKGACSACHTRHRFSKAQARRPSACAKCHLGPDHPQKEVYEESKHGILFDAFSDELNMDSDEWIPGEHYIDAPTCATCHMSATPNQQTTHDVATRLSWNLRAPISKRTENWEQKLTDMKDVCQSCHADNFVDSFYQQLDSFVGLYNDKFAIPAKEIRDLLMGEEVISKQNFDDKIDWIYWELWHHEGRRARHGAAMSGPDYAWWHGIYDVAKNFYTEFLPHVEEACEEAGKPQLYEDIIEKYINSRPEHEWFTKGFDPERVEAIKQYYRDRYNQEVN